MARKKSNASPKERIAATPAVESHLSGAVHFESSPKAEGYLEKAYAAFRNGEMDLALREVTHAIGLNPDFSAAHQLRLKLGSRLEPSERLKLAGDLIATSGSYESVAWAADSFRRFKRLDEALAAWRKALELRPDASEALLGAAFISLKLHHYADASNYAAKVLSQDAVNPHAVAVRAEALSKLKIQDDAETAIARLIDIDPPAAVKFVPFLVSSKKWETAARVVSLNESKFEPDISETIIRGLNRNIKIAHERNELEREGQAWAALISLEKDNERAKTKLQKVVSALIKQGGNTLAAGDAAAGIATLEAARNIDPTQPGLLRKLALAYEKSGDGDKSIQYWVQIGRLTRDPEAWQRVMRLIKKMPPDSTHLSILHEAIEYIDGGDEVGNVGKSISRKLAKQVREMVGADRIEPAAEILQDIRRWNFDPESLQSIEAKIRRSLRERVRGDLDTDDRSVNFAKILHELEPANKHALKLLGKYQAERRNFSVAAEYYGRLAVLQPDSESTWKRFVRYAGDGEAGRQQIIDVAEEVLAQNPDHVVAARFRDKAREMENAWQPKINRTAAEMPSV